MYIKGPYICFNNRLSSSGGLSQRNTRTSHRFTRSKDQTLKTQNIEKPQSQYKHTTIIVHSQYVVQLLETYVGVFNIHYICILSSAFFGCYKDFNECSGFKFGGFLDYMSKRLLFSEEGHCLIQLVGRYYIRSFYRMSANSASVCIVGAAFVFRLQILFFL